MDAANAARKRNMKEEIEKSICTCVESENTLFTNYNTWRQPLISFIDTNDIRINKLKEIVSKDHLLPHDVLHDAKSIICFFIPFTKEIYQSNIPNRISSQEWALTYIRTNTLIAKVSSTIETLMNQSGYAVGKIPATHNFDQKTLISNWSHRHIAYLSGLGSFGINNMLITDNGCCGRLGSIVTNYPFDTTIKSNKERCIYKINGKCGVCINRCVNNAFPNKEYNRFTCYEMCLENSEVHKNIGYADVCGKCLVGLPCSYKDPSK